MMKIVFTGHRETAHPWPEDLIAEIAYRYGHEGYTWITGGARGFDQWVMAYVLTNNLPVELETWPADWNKYGKSAGMIRNKEMVDEADVLVCFWDGRKTGGTYGTIQYALEHGKCIISLYTPVPVKLPLRNIAIGG